MLNKIFKSLMLVALCCCIASCSSETFKLEGELPDAGEQTLRAIYVNEAGVQTVMLPIVEGRFEMEGVSPSYTVLYLFDSKRKPITKVILKNGDKVKIKGTVKHSALLEIKGNDVVEDWNKFRKENHLLYSEEGNETELDTKIEDYVENNGDKLASLVILLHDYSNLSNTERVHELLNMIEEEKREAQLMKAYADMNAELLKKSDRAQFHSFEFLNEKDSVQVFMPVRSKMSVIYFCSNDDADRKEIVTELDSLYSHYGDKKKLQVADVMLDSDTTRWKRSVRREKKKWKRYWAVGGMLNKSLKDVEIKSTPEFMVLDSVGQSVYRGDSIEVVVRLVEEKFGKKETKESEKK